MTHAKNPIKLREIIIAASVGVIMLVLGIIFDYKLTSAIYHPGSENWFGVIGAACVELPVCIGLGFGGMSLILIKYEGKKWQRIFFLIIGIIAVAASFYFIFDTFKDIYKDIQRLAEYKTLITILGLAFAVVMEGLIVLFTWLCKTKWGFDEHDMFVFGLFMIIIAVTDALTGTAVKYLWSRPRPRYIFGLADPLNSFHPVWQIDPFKSLLVTFKDPDFNADNLKSFPSGHTLYATTAIFFLPYIASCSSKLRDDRRIVVLLFYIGLLWAIMAALSRVFAGAHFLSDTAVGFIISVVVGSLIHFLVLFRKAPVKEAK